MKGDSAPNGASPFSGGIRGEVLMTKEVLHNFYPDKKNCRNAANGLMKRKDGSGSERLEIICYDAAAGTVGKPFTETAPFTTETEKLNWLKTQGFLQVPVTRCGSVREVIDYRAHVMDIRSTIPYDIDGLVIKNDRIDTADLSRARPEKQIAFKFSLEEAVTALRSVEWSESGATYTPIALIDPVQLAGTTVKRANLCNPNMIAELNLKIGSRVLVTKRGEIIPKIEALIENPASSVPIEQPCRCTSCGAALRDEGTRLYCPNPACPKLIHHRIEKWINTLDIQDFGTALLKQLFDAQRLRSISDLYTLTVEELAALERMGKKSAEKVYRALHAKREIPLPVFIAASAAPWLKNWLMRALIALKNYSRLRKKTLPPYINSAVSLPIRLRSASAMQRKRCCALPVRGLSLFKHLLPQLKGICRLQEKVFALPES